MDPTPRPHVLILMPDQMRADCMGSARHPVIETPNMDRLAGEGTRFVRTVTTSPLCMPARASFVSGLYAHNHGMWNNAGHLPAHDETFFHHLQRAGYTTAYVGKSHFYPHTGDHLRDHEDYMRARGLDHVHETTGPWATVTTDSYMTDDWREKGLLQAFRDDYRKRRETGPCSVWPSPLPTEDFLDSYIGRKAVEWVESYEGEGPACLFVGFGGPHEPWDAPGEYATMYDPSAMPPAIPPGEPGDWLPEKARHRMLRRRVKGMTEEDIGKIRASYYGKISLIDYWFGRILEAFERRGWWENTLVIFWSDHGEMAGDHGYLHKSNFHSGALQVPFILRWPDRIPAAETSDALVEITDAFPTLLEALGLQPSDRALGESLWPILTGEAPSVRDAAFSEVNSISMVMTERYKYAVDAGGDDFMLYDLHEDPHERNNLIAHPDLRSTESALRDRLLTWLLATQVRQS